MKVHFNEMIFDLNISGHRYLLHNEVDEIAYYRVMREMATQEDEEAFNAHVQLINDAISNRDVEKLCELELEDIEQTYRFNYVKNTLDKLLSEAGYDVEEIKDGIFVVINDLGQSVKIGNRKHITDIEYDYVINRKNTIVQRKDLEKAHLLVKSTDEDSFYF